MIVQKIINTVKYQKELPTVTRINLLILCIKINYKSLDDYQLRLGFKMILNNLVVKDLS